MKRLLVTGSRNWTDADAVMRALDEAVDVLWPNDDPNRDPITLVHGDARGADRLAASIWASRWNMPTEAHPADWTGPCVATCPSQHRKWNSQNQNYCPRAGHRRNAEMVELGADLCMAFILDRSAGATQCARLAAKAGIQVRRIEVTT